MRATIKDVSREAGVSIKTVSRVLNDERYVGVETRARVEAAVARLGFRPNSAARSLAGRRSFQVGLICDNPSPYYVYEMQAGVRARCEAAGVRMLAQPYDRHLDTLAELVEALIDTTHLDGLILTPSASDDTAVLDLLDRRGVRMVRVAPVVRPGTTPASLIDNEGAAAAMTARLIALGHRRIGFVAGHPDYANSGLRTAGFRRAMAQAGLAVDEALVIDGAFDFPSGARAGEAMLAGTGAGAGAGAVTGAGRPTAIFAASDDMAAGVLAAAHRLGLSLPGALSVAGFGDDALAGYVWPPLTTVRQPTRRLGWEAADLLLTGEPGAAEQRQLPVELVERGSTAAPGR